jgi:hypothetical protein
VIDLVNIQRISDVHSFLYFRNVVAIPGMAANVFGSKTFKPTPPDKGSFPLDHDGECKKFYLKFMICLTENKHDNSMCREQSKDYLDCRMKCGLMDKTDWDALGFADLDKKTS